MLGFGNSIKKPFRRMRGFFLEVNNSLINVLYQLNSLDHLISTLIDRFKYSNNLTSPQFTRQATGIPGDNPNPPFDMQAFNMTTTELSS